MPAYPGNTQKLDKGKPAERPGRKAEGSKARESYDSPAADVSILPFIIYEKRRMKTWQKIIRKGSQRFLQL